MKPDRAVVLVLEDGREFSGRLVGGVLPKPSANRAYGEVVFNTGMTGYQEILPDPSYHGQIVVMTLPHVGNTGINSEDVESAKAWPAAFLVQEYSPTPSNWRSEETLLHYLERFEIPLITDVDTRDLTRHLRSRGVLRGVVVDVADRARAREWLETLPKFETRDLIAEVTTDHTYTVPAIGPEKFHVVALDFGIKTNQLRHLQRLGCRVTVCPAQTDAKSILALKPDGLFLSNGPGNPALATYAQTTLRSLLGVLPVFGVCMGHQVLSLALGAKTYKLRFGHRGANQPVKNLSTSHVEISSHNHGYAVDDATLPEGVHVLYKNLNDDCCEGIVAPKLKAFSVQFHPEAFPGPNDSAILFEQFAELMKTGHVPKVP